MQEIGHYESLLRKCVKLDKTEAQTQVKPQCRPEMEGVMRERHKMSQTVWHGTIVTTAHNLQRWVYHFKVTSKSLVGVNKDPQNC